MGGPPTQRLQRPLRIALGVPVAFAVGFLSAVLGIGVPAPPTLLGALIVAAMTLGYLLADRFLVKQSVPRAAECSPPLDAVSLGVVKPDPAAHL